MKQILQSLKTGNTEVANLPVPAVDAGKVLIQTSHTLVSSGTERMLVEFGKSSLIEKARQQPDKVKMVLDKIKNDGFKPTLEAVFNKLDKPMPLGYCNVGRIYQLGKGVTGFTEGNRVISNGQHSEVVTVPVNLCAKVPDCVSDKEAAFTVLGAIGLQGIRLIQPTLGETVVVTGLGLIGLMAVQLLRANGCRVLGLDYDKDKLLLAEKFGAEVVDLSIGQDPIYAAEKFSRGRGVDAVLVTAATQSSEPMHQAALMCRKRGRIVLVGVSGLELSREDFFKKELTFQVSASYGPGRYDPIYEEKGYDYPIGFVRWTEQRNFEAILDLMAEGNLNVKPLISHCFPIDEAEKAYDLISSCRPSLGILLNYPENEITPDSSNIKLKKSSQQGVIDCSEKISVSFLGAGNYARAVLIPAFKKAGSELRIVASSKGVSGLHAGRKYGFDETTTETERLFKDELTDAVVINTRHNTHAYYVVKALKAGKHVFVEKPLCLNLDQIDEIEVVFNEVQGRKSIPFVMVGFNRRFAPHVQKMKKLLNGVTGPKAMVMTINAGNIPAEHWTQNLEIGGGRIVGEACHFIDLLRFLAGSPISQYCLLSMDTTTQDTVTIQLRFDNGSIGTLHYLANGSKSFPKERLEVFVQGRVLQLDNFRKLKGFGWTGFKKMNLWRQDKGQNNCVDLFVQTLIKGGAPPIPIEEILEVSRVTIQLANLALKG